MSDQLRERFEAWILEGSDTEAQAAHALAKEDDQYLSVITLFMSEAWSASAAISAEELEKAKTENERLRKALEDLREALTGDPEPELWSISYIEAIVRHLDGFLSDMAANDRTSEGLIERWFDCPQDTFSALREADHACKRLRSALATLGGQE